MGETMPTVGDPETTRRWRQFALRLDSLRLRYPTHPTWAAARVENYLDYRAEHRDGPLSTLTKSPPIAEMAEIVMSATSDAIADALKEVPRPTLFQNKVHYNSPDPSHHLLTLIHTCSCLLHPTLVVETGAANDYASATMLEAEPGNVDGALISNDFRVSTPTWSPRSVPPCI